MSRRHACTRCTAIDRQFVHLCSPRPRPRPRPACAHDGQCVGHAPTMTGTALAVFGAASVGPVHGNRDGAGWPRRDSDGGGGGSGDDMVDATAAATTGTAGTHGSSRGLPMHTRPAPRNQLHRLGGLPLHGTARVGRRCSPDAARRSARCRHGHDRRGPARVVPARRRACNDGAAHGRRAWERARCRATVAARGGRVC